MVSRLHITNGDSAVPGITTADPSGETLPWRDILHEGPVPAGLSLGELSRLRAEFLSSEEMGDRAEIAKSLAERDDCLRRFTDFDEVVLWFEWDLYDQLQLLQILDFLSNDSSEELAETGTRLSIICIAGYLGTLPTERFPELFEARVPVTEGMVQLGRRGWHAFRSSDPRNIEQFLKGDTTALEFLAGALTRHLEEFPSTRNGLSRSEEQILEAVSQGPRSFAEIFKQTSAREERVYCGDATMARYIERMSRHAFPLLRHPTGEAIDAPRTDADSRSFRNSEIALTPTGMEVLRCDRDWVELGGASRWLGGVHLDGSKAAWRWNPDAGRLETRENRA